MRRRAPASRAQRSWLQPSARWRRSCCAARASRDLNLAHRYQCRSGSRGRCACTTRGARCRAKRRRFAASGLATASSLTTGCRPQKLTRCGTSRGAAQPRTRPRPQAVRRSSILVGFVMAPGARLVNLYQAKSKRKPRRRGLRALPVCDKAPQGRGRGRVPARVGALLHGADVLDSAERRERDVGGVGAARRVLSVARRSRKYAALRVLGAALPVGLRRGLRGGPLHV